MMATEFLNSTGVPSFDEPEINATFPKNYSSSSCDLYRNSEHWSFQVANGVFLLAYAVPATKCSILLMHSLLLIGFMLLSAWAWRVVCAPDMFSWNLCFFCINAIQLVQMIYRIRPIRFDPELEEAYYTLFRPFKVSRLQFKKLIGDPLGQIMSLHTGEAYAIQNVTRTDRLALLLSGRINVLQDHQSLHPILPCEFLDSPEFESRAKEDEKFKVSIVAAVPCRFLCWQRSSLEYLFIKETYLATVIASLVATDITHKLYLMNNKIITEEGSHLDIRFPGITRALIASQDRPGVKLMRKRSEFEVRPGQSSPESANCSRERLLKSLKDSPQLPNGKIFEMEPLNEMQSTDDLTSGSGVDSWFDTSSKYHSCELLES